MKYIIQDWAGNRMFPDKQFDSFDDGWCFLYEEIPKLYPNLSEKEEDDQLSEYFVIPLKS